MEGTQDSLEIFKSIYVTRKKLDGFIMVTSHPSPSQRVRPFPLPVPSVARIHARQINIMKWEYVGVRAGSQIPSSEARHLIIYSQQEVAAGSQIPSSESRHPIIFSELEVAAASQTPSSEARHLTIFSQLDGTAGPLPRKLGAR